MRGFVAGLKDGKSCIVKQFECNLGGAEAVSEDFLELSIDPLPPRPPGKGDFHDLGTPPGCMRWRTIHFPPQWEWYSIHHTDTIDLHTVVTGSIDLILDDGVHTLVAGDYVAIMGVDHSWRTGDEGGVTSSILIGTPPP